MANEMRGVCIGFYTSSADNRTNQYRWAKVSGNKTLTVAAATTDDVVGVIQNAPNTNEAVDLMVTGISKMVAGAAIVAGAKLMPDAAGRAITATTGNAVRGKAMTSTAALGEIVEVLLPYSQSVAP